jgi:hypothetical protein
MADEAKPQPSDPALERLEAAIGKPKDGPFHAGVEVGANAGLSEMNLLARRLLDTAAEAIAGKVSAVRGSRTCLYLTAADSPPDAGHHIMLEQRLELVEAAQAGAAAASDAAGGGPHVGAKAFAAVAPAAAIGLVLSASNALLGYLRTEYKINGATLAIPDRPLLLLLAARLQGDGITLFTEASPVLPDDASRKALAERLRKLALANADLQRRIAAHKERLARLAAPPPEGGAQDAAADAGEKARNEQALAACTAAVALNDGLIAMLYADSAGIPFIERALREQRLRALMKDGLVVSVKLDGAWGSSLGWSNFLSNIGSKPPVRVGATLGASWAVYDPADGRLLGSGIATEKTLLFNLWDIND